MQQNDHTPFTLLTSSFQSHPNDGKAKTNKNKKANPKPKKQDVDNRIGGKTAEEEFQQILENKAEGPLTYLPQLCYSLQRTCRGTLRINCAHKNPKRLRFADCTAEDRSET